MCYPPVKIMIKNPFPDLYKYFKSRFFGEESEKNIELREILIEDQPSFSKEEYINQLPEAIYEQPETPMSPKDIDSALAFLNTIDENYDIIDNVDS